MDLQNREFEQLIKKLEALQRKQDALQNEISAIKSDIRRLQRYGQSPESSDSEVYSTKKGSGPGPFPKSPATPGKAPEFHGLKTDLEEFIGGNLINKVGIIILILGIGIGAKLAIDYNLVSPVVRIILGYVLGFSLYGLGNYLTANYRNFSAVLISGSMAILYFITYAAHTYYELFTMPGAFLIMVIITGYTVYSSFEFDREIIAVIGLVGAYALPFLIRSDAENYRLLFSYIVLINSGILVVSVRKYWRILFYFSFGFTWLLAGTWYWTDYSPGEDLIFAFTVNFLFFLIFYCSFIVNKLLNAKKFSIADIVLLLGNSFIFYALGYGILGDNVETEKYQGIFTLVNAGIHAAVGMLVQRKFRTDRNVYNFIIGLVIAFVTIFIPVQLNGRWVTLFWFSEAAILFRIGRSGKADFYEYLSYAVMILAFYGILYDWWIYGEHFHGQAARGGNLPFFNVSFVTNLLCAGIMLFINVLHYNPRYGRPAYRDQSLIDIADISITGILVIIGYYAIRLEISSAWSAIYAKAGTMDFSSGPVHGLYRKYDLLRFRTLTLFIYSMLFFSGLVWANIKKFNDNRAGIILTGLNSLLIFLFLLYGLYVIGDLRESYILAQEQGYLQVSEWYIGVRYAALAGVILLIYSHFRLSTDNPSLSDLWKKIIIIQIAIAILWLLSSELIHWMELWHSDKSYKITLSILWGTYSLFLVAAGIRRRIKYLRVSGIVLFGVTLLKLFFYDLLELNTISKTIAFISLGILLLIISFLYNKYRSLIFRDE